MLGKRVYHFLADVRDCLIPGNTLPLARTALAHPFQRIAQAILFIHGLGVDRPLVTAAWIGVRYLPVDLRILGKLFLAYQLAVLCIQPPGAVALTIGAMESKALGIALGISKFLTVKILPRPFRIGSQRIVHAQHLAHGLAGEAHLEGADPAAGILQEISSIHH